MYEGYLELGGVEIVNSARAKGYTDTADCPINWLFCPPCEGVPDALGDLPYTVQGITDAPWYDVEDEVSHRFLGLHAITVDGATDSTRTAAVTQAIGDGGVVGRVRHEPRTVRVRALLTAVGQDSLEYGLSWLDAVLQANHCKVHSDSCGTADARFFVACPPAANDITMPETIWNDLVTNLVTNPSFETPGTAAAVRTNYFANPAMRATGAAVEVARNYATNPSFETTSGVETVRRNQATNPRMENSVAGWAVTGTGVTQTAQAGGTRIDFGSAIAAQSPVLYTSAVAPSAAGEVAYAGIEVTVPVGQPAATLTVRIQAYLAGGGTTDGGTSSAAVTIQPGQTVRLTSPTFTALSTGVGGWRLWLNAVAPGVAAGSSVIVRNAIIEKSVITTQPYFDGTTPAAGDFSYSWSGAADGSVSVQTGLDPVGTPPTFVASISSTAWASTGTRSCRLIPIDAANTSRSVIVAQRAVVAAEVYTVSAKFRLAAPLTGALWSNALKLSVYFADTATLLYSSAVPNVAGVYPVTVTVTVPAGDTKMDIRANVGASIGGGDLWVDDVVVTKGTTPFPYFDGATAADPANGLSYAWAGTANLSESTMSGVAVNSAAVTTGRGAVYKVPEGVRALFTAASTQNEIGFGRASSFSQTTATMIIRAKASRALSGTIRLGIGSGANAPVNLTTAFQDFRITGVMGTVGAVVHLGLVLNTVAGDTVTVEHALIVPDTYVDDYFDGATVAAGDFSYAWAGTANASASVQSGVEVVSPAGRNVVAALRSTAWASTGAASMRLIPTGAANTSYAYAALSTMGLQTGKTYTVMATAHLVAPLTGALHASARSIALNQGVVKAQAPNLAGEHPLRMTFTVDGTIITTAAALLFYNGAAAGGGDVWWDDFLIVEGDYAGDYFDGDGTDSADPPEEFTWTGAAHASASTHRTGQIIQVPDPVAYSAAVQALVRNLHTVTCISGPLIQQKLHRGNAWGYIVEFTLVAGTPYVYGVTQSVLLGVSPPIVMQDAPFNLVPYPSAELAGPVITVATNYSTNPSVELNNTGWTVVADGVNILVANVAGSRTTELAAAGTASQRALWTAPAAGATAGWFGTQQDVVLPHAVLAGERYSINMWAAMSVQVGTPVLGQLLISVNWRTGSVTTRTDTMPAIPLAGGAGSLSSVAPPVGCTSVIVRAYMNIPSWPAGTIVRLYADALAVTVP